MAIVFDPDPELIAEAERKVDERENEGYEWDFVNEGTSASEAVSMAKAIVEAEQDARRWVCCVIGEGDRERVILEPVS